MAGSPDTVSLRARTAWVVCIALGLAPQPATGQTRVTLRQVNQRVEPDFTPAMSGQKVIVRGVVNAPAFKFPGYTLLGIQEGNDGSVLEVAGGDRSLDGYQPGDELEAEGTVGSQAGMISVWPTRVTVLSRKPRPAPVSVSVENLQGFPFLGRLVVTEGIVLESDDTTYGPFILVGSNKGAYRLFWPTPAGQRGPELAGIHKGDKVRVRGVALQYCPRPPYNTRFQLLVGAAADVATIERSPFLPPVILMGGLVVMAGIGLFLWSRERRMRHQRERLRYTYQVGEEILSSSSSEAILERLRNALPGIMGISRVHLYVYNRAAKALDAVVPEGGEPLSISLSAPPAGTPAGAVACFHYRTLLVIPDIARSPFPMAETDGRRSPKSLLFVPMMAQGEVTGVLELDQDDHARDFTDDEQALAQHLGNHIAVAIRLLDQRSVQEQLFRTEKLAAVGRLITGVVNELQMPLSSISDLARLASERARGSAAERDVAALASEAQKAAAMVARLVSFASAEQVEARPVAVTTLLHSLIEFREGDWKASGIRVRDLITREPVLVLGSQGQLEQVFLNLMVHAEQSLAEAAQKVITVRTSVLAKRLLVEIVFTAQPDSRTPDETAAVLGVTRSVIAGHGGEVRLIEKPNADPRFEVELPVTTAKERTAATPAAAAPVNGSSRDHGRRMTALVIEPEDSAQRQVLALLSSRGFRVVPVTNADTGLDLAHRVRFDAAFCSVHAPGLNWVELSERMQSRVGGFVLLSDGYDAELSSDFEGEGRFVLPKPVQEQDLDRILRALEPMAPATKNGAV